MNLTNITSAFKQILKKTFKVYKLRFNLFSYFFYKTYFKFFFFFFSKLNKNKILFLTDETSLDKFENYNVLNFLSSTDNILKKKFFHSKLFLKKSFLSFFYLTKFYDFFLVLSFNNFFLRRIGNDFFSYKTISIASSD
jgi:hypothetical protein